MARTEAPAPPAEPAAALVPVRVWDWPVRLFHWTLAALVTTSVATAYAGGTWMTWHMRSGFAILALLAFRILWGFAGTRWARFASFVHGPATVLAYARTLVVPPHANAVGHNPLGGWMVVVLLLVLLAQATTGLFANDDIFTEGPLAKFISKDRSDQLTSFHNRNPWLIYGLVALHVLAVIGHRVRFGEALVQAMLTGVKRLPAALAGEGIGPVPHLRAVVLFAACAAAVWYVVTRL